MWAAFTVFSFFIIGITPLILYSLSSIGIHLGLLPRSGDGPLVPILVLILISISIANGISFVVGKKVLNPISAISHAMTEVAKGNFNVRLNYNGRVGEINEMWKNFNAMVHDLGNIETLRNDFVVTVSHEYKTPLASIEGYAAILQNPELTREEISEYAQKITESTKQLAKLSSNILMLSNLENREIITEKTRFRLDEQIRQSVLLLEPAWENKKLNLSIDLEHAVFYGNEELLMQVWLNVIGNAIKFTPKNGEITIALKETPGFFTVTVKDTGIGIPADVQKYIFDKFYQADHSGYTDGNGLGLSLVRRIIDLCRGRIQVKSEPGQGTAFLIELPAGAESKKLQSI